MRYHHCSWAALFLTVALPLDAQDQRPTYVLSGEVRDAMTGQPIATAVIRVEPGDASTWSHENGRFMIGAIPPGQTVITVHRLGYVEARFPWEARSDLTLVFELEPDPVILEGIEVAVSRLDERLRRVAHQVDVWTADDLRRSDAPEVAWFLHDAAGSVECAGLEAGCVVWRGARSLSLEVFVDDRHVPEEPWRVVATYPLQQISRIEFIRRCRMIRIYTTDYVDRVARGTARPSSSVVAECLRSGGP